jgi:hypothetical protein
MIITRKQFEEEVTRRVDEIRRWEFMERRLGQLETDASELRHRIDGLEWQMKKEPVPVETCCCKGSE